MSTYGTLFRVTTFGESHGKAVGCIVDGFPPGVSISEYSIQPQLDRRKPGQSSLTTSRNENDRVKILSGVEGGLSLGTPITMVVENQDMKKFDYANTTVIPRPGHADYTYDVKYNSIKSQSGGGRSSARETIARVCAGALADSYLTQNFGTKVIAYVSSIGHLDIPNVITNYLQENPPSKEDVDAPTLIKYSNEYEEQKVFVRCPHKETAVEMCHLIEQVRKENDSIGGVITCIITNPPIGIGEPCFSKLEAELAKAMLSIPATKGFEIGSGFAGSRMRGSQHNDTFSQSIVHKESRPKPYLFSKTNSCGGTLGGISNGNNIVFRVAFKPTSSISVEQETMNFEGEVGKLQVKGRHDPCVLPRCPPIVEAMASIVLMDLTLQQYSRNLSPIVSHFTISKSQ